MDNIKLFFLVISVVTPGTDLSTVLPSLVTVGGTSGQNIPSEMNETNEVPPQGDVTTELAHQMTTEVVTQGPTTEMWFGTGRECILRIIRVYKLPMSQREYMCKCMDQCFDTKEESDKSVAKVISDSKRDDDKEHVIVKGCMYGLIFLVGICGNILVLVSVSKFMGRMTVTNMYILNLAAADLLVILFCVPSKALEGILMRWPHELGLAGCKIAMWLYFGSFMCSAFTLMCMALERYMVINHPMKMQSISSHKRTGIVLVGIWIAGVALSSPAFAVTELTNLHFCSVSSTSSDGMNTRLIIYLYIFITILVIPSILMGFAYIRISITLWKSIKKQKNMQSQQKGDEEKAKDTQAAGRVQEKLWVIRILISVLVVFIICWAPYLSLQIYMSGGHDIKDTKKTAMLNDLNTWLNFLSLMNSCLNPLLYGAMSRSFRMGFIRCLTCNKKGQEPVKSYISASNTTGVLNSKNTSVTNAYALTTVKDDEKAPTRENGEISNGQANPAFDDNNGVPDKEPV